MKSPEQEPARSRPVRKRVALVNQSSSDESSDSEDFTPVSTKKKALPLKAASKKIKKTLSRKSEQEAEDDLKIHQCEKCK